MSMSIDINVIDINLLKKEMKKIVKPKDDKLDIDTLIDRVLPEFGIVYNGLFIVQTADYWDDYCSSYQCTEFFERYYQIEELYDVFSKARVAWRYEGANADDVADTLNIELPPHPYDEDEE